MTTKTKWPRQSEVLAYKSPYGDPRGRYGMPSKVWQSTNLTYVAVPFAMRMADMKISRIAIHKHCAQSLARILAALKTAASGSQETLEEWGVTRFGGSFNYRPMRGSTTLSMHAFGCAIDLDPANNFLGDATPRFARYPQVLDAFKAEGWTWGGDWDGDGTNADQRVHDGMHWQATAPLT